MTKFSQRAAEAGEKCTCGRQAVTVFSTDREIGYCGLPDSGDQSGPCPFCGATEPHRTPWGGPARCPQYQLRPVELPSFEDQSDRDYRAHVEAHRPGGPGVTPAQHLARRHDRDDNTTNEETSA